MESMIYNPPAILFEPLKTREKFLLGPGPSNLSERVLKSMSRQLMGHLHPEIYKIMDEVKLGCQYIFQTSNPVTVCISASGNGGMEAALCNLVEDGDVVLIGIAGIWGLRAFEIAERYGADARKLQVKQLGHGHTLDEIEDGLILHKPRVLFLAQGESSTGVLQPLEGVGELCRKYNCLLIVDTVASLGGTPFYADKWKIDVVYTGSQKVLGAAPGITPITFNDRAMEKVANRKTPIKVYYWDINLLGDYWNCFGRPRVYHHTLSVTLLYGLREALALICDEGLENLIERHIKSSERLHNGLNEMGMELFVEDPMYRLPTVTAIRIPAGIDWNAVSKYANDNFSVEFAAGLGPTAGKIFRVGLLGQNATIYCADLALETLRQSIEALHSCKQNGLH